MGLGRLRSRIRIAVFLFAISTILLSIGSLVKIAEINRNLRAINEISVPMGRLMAQLRSNSSVLGREYERVLGTQNWDNPQWVAKPVPGWIVDTIEGDFEKLSELITSVNFPNDSRLLSQWHSWIGKMRADVRNLEGESGKLGKLLAESGQSLEASQWNAKWREEYDTWRQNLEWGGRDIESVISSALTAAEKRVADLKLALKAIVGAVIFISMILLWYIGKSMAPLTSLTQIVREITKRGFQKTDKSSLEGVLRDGSDEIRELAHEFRSMASALLERESIVNQQKIRLEEQNKLLHELAQFNDGVLSTMTSVLIVIDSDMKVLKLNPAAEAWKTGQNRIEAGKLLTVPSEMLSVIIAVMRTGEVQRIGLAHFESRVFAGVVLPFSPDVSKPRGVILILEDQTEEIQMQERLKNAEKLAAIGHMSAQIAHEIRNPLHAIGLEAELALEQSREPTVKSALQSIQSCVERLSQLTTSYLRLSKGGGGSRVKFDCLSSLENVLATYSQQCQAKEILVDWACDEKGPYEILGDPSIFEQVLGNLMKNAIESIEESEGKLRKIIWTLRKSRGNLSLAIEDSGGGLKSEIMPKLFQPFATTRASGTGLGLSFVKRSIGDMGGEVTASDSSLLRGARFDLTWSNPGES